MTSPEEERAATAYEPSHNSKRQRFMLNWRMDPKDSFSDFIIEIGVTGQDDGSSKEDTTITSYNVHKAILAFGGEKGSGYFASLLANSTAESISNKTRIQLNFKPAAEAFPLLLDYIYGLDGGAPALTIATAAPVYHLADYFEVESLHPKILHFWQKAIAVDDLTACLQQAAVYRIDPLRETVVKKCSQNISNIALDSSLLEATDSQFWSDVYKEREKYTLSHPWFYTLVAEYCSKRKNDLDANAFNALTGLFSRCVPISFDDAVKVLEVEKTVLPPCEELTKLQLEMVEVFMQDWKRWKESTAVQDSVKKISPMVFSHAMNRSVEMALEENEALGELLGHPSAVLPIRVTVTGCGADEANGVYTLDGTEYVKRSSTEVGAGIFNIWLLSTSWGIMKKKTDNTFYCLYSSVPFTNTRLSMCPRMNGWWGYGDDASQPTLTYAFDGP